MDFERLLQPDVYNIPRICESCGGVMVFKGLGEYQCEVCDELAYDDYGKVRNYLDDHRGATMVQVEEATGVAQKTLRRLLREGRLEVAEGSKTFMRCDICGKEIRSGRYCPECEIKAHRNMEEKQREFARKNQQGFGMSEKGDDGHRRFMRDED